MGGTFDPIHIGHLIIAEKAYEQFDLQQIRFMPAGNPPHKQDRKRQTTDEQRIEMVRRAIAGNSHFALSLEDMKPDEYSYTFRTLERLKEQNPDEEYYFIIGGDKFNKKHGWMCCNHNMFAKFAAEEDIERVLKKKSVLI